MKALALVLALAATPALAHPAASPAQASPRNPTPAQAKTIRDSTAQRRAASYKGPHVVKDSKKLGREFIKDSKPAPARLVAPTKQ